MAREGAFRDAAIRILHASRAPLHFERIADRAMRKKMISVGTGVLGEYMGAVLRRDVARHGSKSAFVETAPGYYGLGPDRAQGPDSGMGTPMPVTATFGDAAFRILRGSLGPLHFAHILARAVSEGLIRPNTHTIAALMGEVIQSDVADNGAKSVFVATGGGSYGLRRDHSDVQAIVSKHAGPTPADAQFPKARLGHPRAPQGVPKHPSGQQATFQFQMFRPTVSEPRSDFSSQYVGLGGEYLVASKLLFLNYNVSIPSVDLGADLVVTKDQHSHFYVQVKTLTRKDDEYRFYIKPSSFNRQKSANMFYVFVLRRQSDHEARETFLIIPHGVLEDNLYLGYVQMRNKKISPCFVQDGSVVSLGSPDNDVTHFINNWDLIGQAPGSAR